MDQSNGKSETVTHDVGAYGKLYPMYLNKTNLEGGKARVQLMTDKPVNIGDKITGIGSRVDAKQIWTVEQIESTIKAKGQYSGITPDVIQLICNNT